MSNTYVTDFEYDIFVSYAHVDNQPLIIPGGTSTGWVDTLIENLKRLLSQQLGRAEWGRIWFDPRLRSDEPITPAIEEAISCSAVLLVILSEGYLQSDWCRREREIFLRAADRQGGHTGRLFVVHHSEVERDRWPSEFGELLGYSFFINEGEFESSRTLGTPIVDSGHQQTYFQRLDDLSRQLAQRLRQMRDQTTTQHDEITVFLAEVTADLEDLRDNLRRQLEQKGLRVFPATYYKRSPQAFEEAMRKDLADSVLFVQLLGQYTSLKTADLPKGYEGLQLG